MGIKSGIIDAALQGAVGSALTQGIGKATGLQEKFSWAGVAAAGAASAAGYGIGRGLNTSKGILGAKAGYDSFGNFLASTAASTLASAATRSAIEGSSFGQNLLAAVPDVVASILQRAAATALDGVSKSAKVADSGKKETVGAMTAKGVDSEAEMELPSLKALSELGLTLDDIEDPNSIGEPKIILAKANSAVAKYATLRKNVRAFFADDSKVKDLHGWYIPSDKIRDENLRTALAVINAMEAKGTFASNVKTIATAGLEVATALRLEFSLARLTSQFMLAGAREPEKVASGVVANLWKESAGTFDPSVIEQGKNKPGQGIAQWTTKERKVRFKEVMGVSVLQASLGQQLDFLVFEMTQRELYYGGSNPTYDKRMYNGGQATLKAKTAEEAAKIFMTKFENPADQSPSAVRGRQAMATKIHQYHNLYIHKKATMQRYEELRKTI